MGILDVVGVPSGSAAAVMPLALAVAGMPSTTRKLVCPYAKDDILNIFRSDI